MSTMADRCYQSSSRAQYWSYIAGTAIKLGFMSERLSSIASEHQDLIIPAGISYPGFANATLPVEWERCGVPFQDKHFYDENSLFIEKLLLDDSQITSVGSEEDITTLLVRRSLFLRLFPQSAFYRRYITSPGDNQPQSTVQETPHIETPFPDRLPDQVHDENMAEVPQHPVDNWRRNVDHGPPIIGQYEVTIWHSARGSRLMQFDTRQSWLTKLEELWRLRYVFYVPRMLRVISMSQTSRYVGRSIIAATPRLSHNQVRRAYGVTA